MKVTETTLEIRLDNLADNVRFLRSRTKAGTLFLAVVKAFSYGNNSCEIAKFLEETHLVDYFAVAFVSEGIALREAGVRTPILVLHPQLSHFRDMVAYRLEPSLYSMRMLKGFIDFAKENNLCEYPIHLKCNSGMNRLGFSLSEMEEVCQRIAPQKELYLKSSFSHLVASEDKSLVSQDFIRKQIQRFIEFQQVILKHFSHKVLFHNCNTSGILNYPEAHFDMVRSGIGMYGFANDETLQKHFKPITTLKTIISQIHEINSEDFVGYNFGFQAKKKMRTATLSVGHADGLHRIYGKEVGFVFIQGQKAPILGNVCMDMLMVDVTDISCEEGDEVIVFDEKHTAETLAETAKTISYELITSLSHRIKRVFIK